MDDRGPDLVGELFGIGEILFQRQPEQGDPVRDRRPVGAPFRPSGRPRTARRALVRARSRSRGSDRATARRRSRSRPRRGRPRTAGGSRPAPRRPAPRTGDGVWLGGELAGYRVGAWPWRTYPRAMETRAAARSDRRAGWVRRGRSGPVTGSTSSTGAGSPDGAGVLLVHGLSEHRLVLGARRPPPASSAPRRGRWTCVATGCPMRRPTGYDPGTFAEDAVAVAEGSGLLGDAGRPGRRRRSRVRGDRGGLDRGRTRQPLRGRRPGRRWLGVPGGRQRNGRRRVPPRPRRAARGDGVDGRLPRRPAGIRSGQLGRRPGTRGARDRGRDPCRACRPVHAATRQPRRASGRCSVTSPAANWPLSPLRSPRSSPPTTSRVRERSRSSAPR